MKLKFTLVLSLVLLLTSFNLIYAQTAGDYRTTSSGNWSSASIWQKYDGSTWSTPSDYPGQNTGTGKVTIQNGYAITLDVSPAYSIGSLYIDNGSYNYSLTISSKILTVTGAITMLAPSTSYQYNCIYLNGGTLNAGSITATSSDPNKDVFIAIASSGTLSVTGNITLNGDGTETYIAFWNSTGGTINVGGTITGGRLIHSWGGSTTEGLTYGTVNYNGSSTQSVGAYTYYNLSLSGTGPFVTEGAITVSGAFSSNGEILTSTNITLNGTTQCGGSMLASGGTVSYGANATKIIEGTYNTLLKKGSTTSTLCGDVSVSTALALNGGVVDIANNNLTLKDGATITGTSAFSVSNMISTSGEGFLIKEATATSGFLMTYPIGNGYYNPMSISVLTGTITNTASLKVRAVTQAQGDAFLSKYWQVATANLSSISGVSLLFTYNSAEVKGTQASYLPWVDAEGDGYVNPTNPTSAGVNPFGSTGSSVLAGKWSAGITPPEPAQTWYAYSANGNWSDYNSWTLDGSSNPNFDNDEKDIPGVGDIVFIPSGKKIYLPTDTTSMLVEQIEVNGELDLSSSSGNDFGIILGNGTISMKGHSGVDNFPSGTSTLFADATNGGTVKIYGTSDISLSSARTFNNLLINITGTTASLLADYTLNGNLTIESGTLNINNSSATTKLTLTVNGDIEVDENTTFGVGSGNIGMSSYSGAHEVYCYGNFINNGTVKFTNQPQPVYTSFPTHAVSLIMSGASNSTLSCNGTTDLYRLVVDKGSDKTYTLTVNSTALANFRLYGKVDGSIISHWDSGTSSTVLDDNNKALFIANGTLELTGKIFIPTLTEGGDNYYIFSTGKLFINDDEVTVYSTALSNAETTVGGITGTGVSSDYGGNQSFTVYGDFQIDAGIFNTKTHGFVSFSENSATITINGGEVITPNIRSTSSSTGKYSYIQNGGTVYVLGDVNGGYFENAASFSITGSTNAFIMTGGMLEIQDAINTKAIQIESSDENINVTGGTVRINSYTNSDDNFYISSTAPFHNFEINATNATTTNVYLSAGLTINKNLTIGNACLFDVTSNNYNLAIGGNFTIDSGANFLPRSNTTTINGSSNSNFSFTGIKPVFCNLTFAKDEDNKRVTVLYTNQDTAFAVNGEFRVENGALNYSNYTVGLNGDIYVADTIGKSTNTGKVVLNGKATQDITSEGGVIQNIWVKNSASLTGNLTIYKTLTLDAVLDINTSALTLYGSAASITSTAGTFSTSNMIQTSGNATDGGLKLYVDANETLLFPLGTDANSITRYTPATAVFTNYSDDGYVQMRVVDDQIPMTVANGGDILSYYWKAQHSGFTTVPIVSYTFIHADSDEDGANVNSWVGGRVLDVSPYSQDKTGTYTKESNTITFSNIALSYESYSVGQTNRFNGKPDVYYTRSTSGSMDWFDKSWDLNVIGTSTNKTPPAGAIVVIRGSARVNVTSTFAAPSMVIFDNNTGITATSENVPRLQFLNSGTYDLGIVSGAGMIGINAAVMPLVTGDFGDFGTNPDSYYLYFDNTYTSSPRSTFTLTTIPEPVPNLMLEWATFAINQNLTTNGDVITQQGGTTRFLKDIEIGDDLVIGAYTDGKVQLPDQSTAITVTVDGDVDYTYVPSGGTDGGARSLALQSGSGYNVQHTLILKGDIKQGTGSLDLWASNSTPRAVLELQGESDNTYTRTTGSEAELYRMVSNKGSDQTYSFSFNNSFTLNGPTSGSGVAKALELQNGTVIFNDAGININLTTGNDNFSIPSTAGLTLTAGQANVSGNSTGILLDGTLRINGGTVDMSTSVNNYIEYGASGNATLNISSGTLNVGTQIRRLTTNTAGVLKYIQTGGTVVIGNTTDATKYETSRGMLEVTNTGSEFTYTGGSLTFVRQNGSSPAIAALYLHPDTYDVTGSTITIGNASTPTSQSSFGINSSISLNNLVVNNDAGLASGISVNLATYPLTISGDLTVDAGCTFNAKGLMLTINGNYLNNGTYLSSENTLVFNSSTDHSLSGSGTESIYNLSKTGAGTFTLGKATTVNNDLAILNGALATATYDLNLLGDATIDATMTTVSGNGLVFSGTQTQYLQRSSVGTSTLGTLTINNGSGVEIQNTAHWFVIQNQLRLQDGIFDIGGTLLELEKSATIESVAEFSATNMIQTNSAYQDNGLKKDFAAGYTGTFIYPVGQSKFTPVTFDFSGTGASSGSTDGSITIRPSNEYHPAINNGTDALSTGDINNVLQYYWTLRSDNITSMSGVANFKYKAADALATQVETPTDLTEENYIAARVVYATDEIQKKQGAGYEVDATNHTFNFTFSNESTSDMSGDYFAGIAEAIPSTILTYVTNGTSGGNVNLESSYNTETQDIMSGDNPPVGAILDVQGSDNLVLNISNISLYKTIIEEGATLTIKNTNKHRLGIVTGEGTLVIECDDDNMAFPSGDFTDFFTCTGGSLEYTGAGSYSVMSSLPQVRNLTISGGGTKTLANNDIEICEDFTLEDLTSFNNSSNKDITINGDLYLYGGSFNSGKDNAVIVADSVLVDGGTYNGGTGGNDVMVNLIIKSGAFNVGSAGSISIQGKLARISGTFNGGSSSSKVSMTGSATQVISGDFSSTNAFYNLELNNTKGITLSGNATINNQLVLTNGIITPGANTLLMEADASASPVNGTSSSYVNGKLYKKISTAGNSFTFPIGKSGYWGYASVNAVSVGGYTWNAEYYTAAATNESGVTNFTATDPIATVGISSNVYWKISDGNVGHTSAANIGISWNSRNNVSSVSTDREALQVVVWNGSTWDNYGGTTFLSGHTQSNGSFVSENTVNFSSNIVTLGTGDETNALPIELLSFTGQAQSNTVELSWITASEINNDYFEVQRSTDAVNFTTIGKVSGSGTTLLQSDYGFTDNSPYSGINYYRLKQVDYDGESETFNVISVYFSGLISNSNAYSISVYPNPFYDGDLVLEFNSVEPGTSVYVSVTDISGKTMVKAPLIVPDDQKVNLVPIMIDGLRSGIYIVNVRTTKLFMTQKVIVN